MGCCTDCLEEELQPEYVAPYHPDTTLFAKPQWAVFRQLHYVIYRIGACFLIMAWVLADFLHEAATFYSEDYSVWFIFATNWSFMMLALSSLLQAIYAIYYLLHVEHGGESSNRNIRVFYLTRLPHRQEPGKATSPAVMCLWMVYTIASNSALMVTISYWTFLTAFDTSGFLITPMSKLKHTLNSLYVLIDLMLNAIPIRIFHLVYPLCMGAVYAVFNAVYFINEGEGPDGKPYAYYVMDWRNPFQSAFTCSMGFILTSLLQFILYAVYYIRVWADSRTRHAPLQELEENGAAMSMTSSSIVKPEMEGILSQGDTRPRAASYSSVEQMEMGNLQQQQQAMDRS